MIVEDTTMDSNILSVEDDGETVTFTGFIPLSCKDVDDFDDFDDETEPYELS